MVSLCSSFWLSTCFVAQAGLKLVILMPQPLQGAGICRCVSPHPAHCFFIKFIIKQRCHKVHTRQGFCRAFIWNVPVAMSLRIVGQMFGLFPVLWAPTPQSGSCGTKCAPGQFLPRVTAITANGSLCQLRLRMALSGQEGTGENREAPSPDLTGGGATKGLCVEEGPRSGHGDGFT